MNDHTEAPYTQTSDDDGSAQPTPVRRLFLFLTSLFVIGLVQLLGWLGKGESDPFLKGGLTVLQTTAIFASLIQIIAFVPAWWFQTEKFYDLTGSSTYIICIFYSFAAGYQEAHIRLGKPLDGRAIAATCMVTIWALRLGYFLFSRILSSKKDGRFDTLKADPITFFVVWNIQGLWVFLGCLPSFILNSTQAGTPFVWTDALGGALFGIGLFLEAVSDHQKSVFNSKPENRGKWIDFGLWRYSRHPNYFFEWTLQFGLFLLCMAEFEGTQWIAVCSPVFIAILLAFISGVPLLEKRADEKWGSNPDYQKYKRSTSVCIPLCRLPSEKMFYGQKLLTGTN